MTPNDQKKKLHNDVEWDDILHQKLRIIRTKNFLDLSLVIWIVILGNEIYDVGQDLFRFWIFYKKRDEINVNAGTSRMGGCRKCTCEAEMFEVYQLSYRKGHV